MGGGAKPDRVVMHFGMPKTGTTSIQLSLMRRLSDERFRYLKLGYANGSYAIASAFKADPGRFHRHRKEGTSAEQLRQLREEAVNGLRSQLEAASGRTAILSAEVVFGFDETELQALCRALGRHGAVTAVGYIRRPKEFIESTFQQLVKGGRSNFAVDRLFPRYRARLETIDAVLGRESTRIWLFDPASFPGRCAVQDFCARLGIGLRPEDVTRTNEGLSRPALALLYAYRKFGPGYGVGPQVMWENKLLVRRVRKLPGPKLRLHSSLVAPVLETKRPEIEWVQERLGASLAEDIAAHDEGAVRSEEDLLAFTPESLRWLAGELGDEFAGRWRADMSPREVAEWMHLLRARTAATDPRLAAAASARDSVT
jgi:hypothetical protein